MGKLFFLIGAGVFWLTSIDDLIAGIDLSPAVTGKAFGWAACMMIMGIGLMQGGGSK